MHLQTLQWSRVVGWWEMSICLQWQWMWRGQCEKMVQSNRGHHLWLWVWMGKTDQSGGVSAVQHPGLVSGGPTFAGKGAIHNIYDSQIISSNQLYCICHKKLSQIIFSSFQSTVFIYWLPLLINFLHQWTFLVNQLSSSIVFISQSSLFLNQISTSTLFIFSSIYYFSSCFQEISVPKDCNCVPKDECQSFQDDVEYLKNNKNNISLERLRIRNCGEKGGERKVCCNEPSVKTSKISLIGFPC